jgi:hypothetical protein
LHYFGDHLKSNRLRNSIYRHIRDVASREHQLVRKSRASLVSDKVELLTPEWQIDLSPEGGLSGESNKRQGGRRRDMEPEAMELILLRRRGSWEENTTE